MGLYLQTSIDLTARLGLPASMFGNGCAGLARVGREPSMPDAEPSAELGIHDLKDALREALERRGTMSSLRAHIRRDIFAAMEDGEDVQHPTPPENMVRGFFAALACFYAAESDPSVASCVSLVSAGHQRAHSRVPRIQPCVCQPPPSHALSKYPSTAHALPWFGLCLRTHRLWAHAGRLRSRGSATSASAPSPLRGTAVAPA